MQDTKTHTTTKYTESLDTSANTIAEESTSQNDLISQEHNPNNKTLTEQMQENNLTHETQDNKTQQDSYFQKHNIFMQT